MPFEEEKPNGIRHVSFSKRKRQFSERTSLKTFSCTRQKNKNKKILYTNTVLLWPTVNDQKIKIKNYERFIEI